MFKIISDFFEALCMWLGGGHTWKEAWGTIDLVEKWHKKNEECSKKIFKYFRILNEVPGLKIWMIDSSPFEYGSFSSSTLKMTLESNGKFDHKMETFPSRKELLSFMETSLGGMTLSVEDKSFTFPNFRNAKELTMKLQLGGYISVHV
jgi:hypothetical protein